MIGSIADINIQIGTGIYRLKDVYGKTIYAAKELPVYKSYLSKKPMAKVRANNPIGIVRGYVANGYKGAKQSFLIIGESSASTSVVPYAAGNFNEYELVQQGTKTAKENIDQASQENRPWYIKLSNTIMPWLIVGVVGYQLLKKKI